MTLTDFANIFQDSGSHGLKSLWIAQLHPEFTMTGETKVSSILWSLLRFGQGELQALGLDRDIAVEAMVEKVLALLS